MSISPMDDNGEEVLSETGRPRRLWVVLVIAALLGLVVVVVARINSSSLKATQPSLTSRSAPGTGSVSATPMVMASNILLPAGSDFEQDASGRLTPGTTIRNTWSFPVRVRYPIVIRGLPRLLVARTQVGVFANNTVETATHGLLPMTSRLVRVNAGQVVEVAVSLAVSCADEALLGHVRPGAFRVIVYATPAIGSASIQMDVGGSSLEDQLRLLCHPTEATHARP